MSVELFTFETPEQKAQNRARQLSEQAAELAAIVTQVAADCEQPANEVFAYFVGQGRFKPEVLGLFLAQHVEYLTAGTSQP